jgi:hypothetical protein
MEVDFEEDPSTKDLGGGKEQSGLVFKRAI